MEAYKMKIEFTKFFEKLKENGVTQKEFKEETGLMSSDTFWSPPTTLYNL